MSDTDWIDHEDIVREYRGVIQHLLQVIDEEAKWAKGHPQAKLAPAILRLIQIRNIIADNYGIKVPLRKAAPLPKKHLSRMVQK